MPNNHKSFFILLAALFYSPFFVFAQSQAPAPIVGNPMPSSASMQSPDNGPAFDLSSQDMEKLLKAGEKTLRKVVVKHIYKERKQHVRNTEKAYREAVSLYRQQRLRQARDAFSNVEDAIADYKSTNSILNYIDNQSIQKLKQEMRKIRQIEEVPVVISLSVKAEDLYRDTADLGDDKKMIILRNKLLRVAQVLKALRLQKENKSKQLAVELDRQKRADDMAEKADRFDQEVARLVKARKYGAAKAKFNEFQTAMAGDLGTLKASVTAQREAVNAKNKRRSDVLNRGTYQRLEQNFFRQGIDLYKMKNYEAARIIFSELAYQGNAAAKAYLKKTDHVIEEQYLPKNHFFQNPIY